MFDEKLGAAAVDMLMRLLYATYIQISGYEYCAITHRHQFRTNFAQEKLVSLVLHYYFCLEIVSAQTRLCLILLELRALQIL